MNQKKKTDWGYIASLSFFIVIGLCCVAWIVRTFASGPPSKTELKADYIPVTITITDVDAHYGGNGDDLYFVYGEYVYENDVYEAKLGVIPEQYQKDENYYVGQIVNGYANKSDPYDIWSEIKDLNQRHDKAAVYTVLMFISLIILWIVFKTIRNKIRAKKNKS